LTFDFSSQFNVQTKFINGIDDRLRAGEQPPYDICHPGQLSLAIPMWVFAMSTSESWGVRAAPHGPTLSVGRK